MTRSRPCWRDTAVPRARPCWTSWPTRIDQRQDARRRSPAVRALMFVERFADEVRQRLERLDP